MIVWRLKQSELFCAVLKFACLGLDLSVRPNLSNGASHRWLLIYEPIGVNSDIELRHCFGLQGRFARFLRSLKINVLIRHFQFFFHQTKPKFCQPNGVIAKRLTYL